MEVRKTILNDTEVNTVSKESRKGILTLTEIVDLFRNLGDLPRKYADYFNKVLLQILATNPEKSCLCCIDGRVRPQQYAFLGQAGSGILSISKIISEGQGNNEAIYNNIIDFFTQLTVNHKVNTITSHQDCGAAKVFVNELFSLYDVSDLQKLSLILSKIFDGISFQNPITEDSLVSDILQFISGKLGVGFEHIILEREKKLGKLEIPPHKENGMFINLTDKDVFGVLKKFSFFRNAFHLDYLHSLNKNFNHIEGVTTEQVIIGKMIALHHNNISGESPMEIVLFVDGEESMQLAQSLQLLIEKAAIEKGISNYYRITICELDKNRNSNIIGKVLELANS